MQAISSSARAGVKAWNVLTSRMMSALNQFYCRMIVQVAASTAITRFH
jgi:hypothetical protein